MSDIYDEVELRDVSSEKDKKRFKIIAYHLGIGVHTYGEKENVDIKGQLKKENDNNKVKYVNPDGKIEIEEKGEDSVKLKAVDS